MQSNQVVLECHVEAGYPSPRITWYKGSNQITNMFGMKGGQNCSNLPDGYFYQEEHAPPYARYLVICGQHQSSWYTCEAGNKHGSDVHSAYLNILGVCLIYVFRTL